MTSKSTLPECLAVTAMVINVEPDGVAANVTLGGCGHTTTMTVTADGVGVDQLHHVANVFALNGGQRIQVQDAVAHIAATVCRRPRSHETAQQYLQAINRATRDVI